LELEPFPIGQVQARAIIHEANLWQPKAQRPMAKLAPGTPVFFRL